MPFLAFPNELLIQVAGNLAANTTYSLVRANRRLAALLTPLLHEFALHDELYCITALQSAAADGNKDMVKLLLEKSTVDFQAMAPGGHPNSLLFCRDPIRLPTDPCYWSPGVRNIDCLAQKILNEGVNILIYSLPARKTPLQLAAGRGNEVIVRFLLEKGVEVDLLGPTGYPALYYAALNNHKNTTKILVEYGANINLSQDMKPHPTVLHQAVFDGNEVAVKFLLEFGANAQSEDEHGETPIHWVMDYPNQSIAKLLLDHGADINHRSKFGSTPLLNMIVGVPNISMIRFLLDNNADPDLFDKKGYNPLLWAILGRSWEIVQLLVERGADLSVRSASGTPATDLARMFGTIALPEEKSGSVGRAADHN